MKCKTTKNFYHQQEQARHLDRAPAHITPTFKLSPYSNSYKMPFGNTQRSYSHQQHRAPPPFYPSSFMPRVNYNMTHSVPPPTRPPSQKVDDSWACDYCQVAIFGNFQQACEHEKSCSMNQNVATHEHKTAKEQEPEKGCTSSSRSRNPAQILLCMPTDRQSLSDRQCYVRSHFVEIFEATSMDVSVRHSKGAQKLMVGQIGIRCMHCTQFNLKDRAERGTCYPSSVSRIYQTVADMQRFHFEACTGIPDSMKVVYRSLKTTRPRGQGSPQSYWISSAIDLGLVDTSEGIRFSKDKESTNKTFSGHNASPSFCNPKTQFGMGESSESPTSPHSNQQRLKSLPPLSPESQSSRTTNSSENHHDMSDNEIRDEEANMLLALRSGCVSHSRSSDSQ